jgi:hypothetical protein
LEDWKIKVSVLWLFAALAFATYLIVSLLEPGVIAQIMAGKIEGFPLSQLMLMFAASMWVLLVMAFLSLTLKDPINRWANVIVGAVYAVLWLIDVVEAVQKLSIWMTLINGSGFVALVLIVWYAWTSKAR